MSVHLTFDVEFPDRPANADDTWSAVLDILARHDAPATLFVQGKWAEAHPDRVRRMRDAGHLVGLHSYWHAAYTCLSDAGVREDLGRGREALQTAGVDAGRWFRLPYGRGADSPRVAELLAAEGFGHIHRTVDPRDWHQDTDAEAIAGSVGKAAAGGGPTVVLLHSWPTVTPAGLERVIARLRGEHEFRLLDALPWDTVVQLTDAP
jgi:peptidoglycan/xylan/chitin deacetylase (PgdA/CDA1 family)